MRCVVECGVCVCFWKMQNDNGISGKARKKNNGKKETDGCWMIEVRRKKKCLRCVHGPVKTREKNKKTSESDIMIQVYNAQHH